MSNFDPKELKILSDILALVLEDQPGQSSSALDAIKNRARRDNVTGGALKNLFQAIAPNPSQVRNSRTTRVNNTPADEYRVKLRQMTDSINKLDRDLRSTRAQNENLKSQLYMTQQARAETQAMLSQLQANDTYPRLLIIGVATVAGLLTGIAGTEVFHLLQHAVSSATDNARYLYLQRN